MTKIDRYRYEINENNVIEVWDDECPDELGRPFLRQDVHPNGSGWASKEEAEKWVLSYLDTRINPPVEVLAAEDQA